MRNTARPSRPHLTLPLRGSLPLRPTGAERAGVRWGGAPSAASASRPADERRLALGGEGVDAALDPGEPAVIIVQQDLRRCRYLDPELTCRARAGGQRGGAGERLLAVGGHDRLPGAAALRRVAAASVVLVDEARAAPMVAARLPRAGLDQDVDPALLGDAEQAEAQQAAELAHARIALAPAPLGRAAHGEPHFVAGRRAIDGLQHELEIEAELELADDDERRAVAMERHDIAAAHLALHRKAALLQEALHGQIERGLQGVSLTASDATAARSGLAEQRLAETQPSHGRIEAALVARRIGRLDAQQHEGGAVAVAQQAPAIGQLRLAADGAGDLDAGGARHPLE